MKRFIFSLIVLIGLAVSNVGYALPDVTTEKTEIKVDADTPEVVAVYEMVQMNAPEVFTDNVGETKVTLYGKHKDEAFTYLTDVKGAKNIFTNSNCFTDVPIMVSICGQDEADRERYKQRESKDHITRDQNLTTSGADVNSIRKKWVR